MCHSEALRAAPGGQCARILDANLSRRECAAPALNVILHTPLTQYFTYDINMYKGSNFQ
jgi:hypothetical protein